jgi:probable rRNA maturation factor
MAVDVFAADEQSAAPIELERWAQLARQVLESRDLRADAEVSLLFVDEDTITALNERFLQRQGSTDVLAFPLEDDPVAPGRFPDMGGTGPGSDAGGEPPLLLGDVVVCPAVAERNARARSVPYDDELALLVVHGLLHLLGMDHEVEEEARAMEALERELLDAFFHRP